MSTICFVTYEIHPTNKGGCGVLLHHAAEVLLRDGHEIVFLFDMPRSEFRQFLDRDRLTLPNPDNCRGYLVDDLLAGFPFDELTIGNLFRFKSLRFAHALRGVLQRERIELVEFFEYAGVGYYAFVDRVYGPGTTPVLAARLHSSLELLDIFGGTHGMDRDRHFLYGLERAALQLTETIIAPTQTFFRAHYQHQYGIAGERVVVAQSPKQPFPRVARRPPPAGPYRIAFVGRMFALKGVDQLVHAAVQLLLRRPQLDCAFDLIGYDSPESPVAGSFVAYLRTMIPSDLRDRFVFHGQLSHAAIVERLNDAHACVFPNRIESFCYALHEVYDAGVPVIVNSLPAFADFFTHERNALVYDGTTEGLLAALERIIDDPGLRERLCRPYVVAEQPLGDIYARPRALAPLSEPQAAARGASPGGESGQSGSPRAPLHGVPAPASVVLVLCDAGDPAAAGRTRAALAGQTRPAERVAWLHPEPPGDAETLWLLGRSWRVSDADGRPLAASDLTTGAALLLLQAGDRLPPSWLAFCSGALARRPRMAFAGTWLQRGDVLMPGQLDICPEAYPFDYGARPTRALLRTAPGRLIADLCDPLLGELGEIGYVWQAISQYGPGVLAPLPAVEVAATGDRPATRDALQALLARYGEQFAPRLAQLAGVLHAAAATSTPGGRGDAGPDGRRFSALSHEQKQQIAADLNGTALLKLAVRKLFRKARRIAGSGRPTDAH